MGPLLAAARTAARNRASPSGRSSIASIDSCCEAGSAAQLDSVEAGFLFMDLEYRRKELKLQPAHNEMIGRICAVWAAIDYHLDDLLETLLRCGKREVAAIFTGMADTAPRCSVLRRLIMIDPPSVEWRDWFIAVIDRVQDELGPLRNRYVHDRWAISGEAITRYDKRATIMRPQSRSDKILVHDIEYVSSMEELERFEMCALLVMSMLYSANYDLRHWQREGRPLQPHPQYIPASKRKVRWPTNLEHSQAVHEGQKPPEYIFD